MSISSIKRNDPQQVREARKTLGRLIPKAQARAQGWAIEDRKLYHQTPLWTVTERYMRLKNLMGIFVYETQSGWFADFVLRTAPVGIPKIFGTPASDPQPSRAAAETGAIELLAGIILAERGDFADDNPGISADLRVFDMGGLYFKIPSRLVEAVGAEVYRIGGTAKDANADLTRLVEKDFPCGISDEVWNGLDSERRERYLALFCALLAFDDCRFVYDPTRSSQDVAVSH